jgi:hypothetical protein
MTKVKNELLRTSTLRPGLLVSFKTSMSGNVKYNTAVIEAEHTTKAGEQKAKWETERVVADIDELEAARKARSKISVLVRSVCAWSAFGLLCPETKADELATAIVEARKVAEEFNASANLTRVNVYVMTGRIAADDVEAVKAINSEVRDLLSEMKDGLKNLDVKVVRDAANRARNLGSMLTQDSEVRVRMAIEAARKAAREIVKAGEVGAVEIDKQAIRTITEARTAFLDLDETKEGVKVKARGRAIDLSPEDVAYNEENKKRDRELTKKEKARYRAKGAELEF